MTYLAAGTFSLVLYSSGTSLILTLKCTVICVICVFFTSGTKLSPSGVVLGVATLFLIKIFLANSTLVFEAVYRRNFSIIMSGAASIISLLLNGARDRLIRRRLAPRRERRLRGSGVAFSRRGGGVSDKEGGL